MEAQVQGKKIKVIGLEVRDKNRFQAETVSGKPVFVAPQYSGELKLKILNTYITLEDLPLSPDLQEVTPETRGMVFYAAITALREAADYLENQAR
jgi:hypothetical protein